MSKTIRHYGVKGMKWDETKGKLSPEEKAKLRAQQEEARKAKRGAAEERKVRRGINEAALTDKKRSKRSGGKYDEKEAKEFWAKLFKNNPNLSIKETNKAIQEKRRRAEVRIRQMLKLQEELKQEEGGDPLSMLDWDEDGNQILVHHGIKGMKWGVIRKNPSGGTKSTASADHAEVAMLRKRPMKTLSNAELKTLTNRLNLEKQYKDLSPEKTAKATKAVNDFIKQYSKQIISKAASHAASEAWKYILERHVKNEDQDDKVLQHYGVKGMKWGVRKERPTSGGRRSSGGNRSERYFDALSELDEKVSDRWLSRYNSEVKPKKGIFSKIRALLKMDKEESAIAAKEFSDLEKEYGMDRAAKKARRKQRREARDRLIDEVDEIWWSRRETLLEKNAHNSEFIKLDREIDRLYKERLREIDEELDK